MLVVVIVHRPARVDFHADSSMGTSWSIVSYHIYQRKYFCTPLGSAVACEASAPPIYEALYFSWPLRQRGDAERRLPAAAKPRLYQWCYHIPVPGMHISQLRYIISRVSTSQFSEGRQHEYILLPGRYLGSCERVVPGMDTTKVDIYQMRTWLLTYI